MKKIIKFSVGISAYNEEKNIGNLLKSISSQKLSNSMSLIEIIVVSDGSSDKTVEICKKMMIKNLKVITGNKRIGKNQRINQIFEISKGEILILFDADIALGDEYVLERMVNAFVKNGNIGLVAGNVQPVSGITMPEKAFNNFVDSLNYMKKRIKNGNNVFSARGPLLALSRNFINTINIPENVPEDRYLYFKCLAKGFKFVYQDDAKVYFRSPQTIEEQINQGNRFKKDKENLYLNFESEFINNEYFISFSLRVQGLLLQVFKNPKAYLYMKYMHYRILKNNSSFNTSPKWNITKSTKEKIII